MATKTISIDLEAYELLRGARREAQESFSCVIKRVVRPPIDLEAYLEGIDRYPLSDEGVGAIEIAEEGRHALSKRER